MPGFNLEQQRLLATLARFQRKSLKLGEMEEFALYKKKHIINLVRVLRLAIVLNGQRSDEQLPEISLGVDAEDKWSLTCKDNAWLEKNKLLHADLVSEQAYWHSVDWQLTFS
ncbi:exopolyphosphatase [Vibrio ponticus]|nr:exopolyphosphatase [Vibrio ponticus]